MHWQSRKVLFAMVCAFGVAGLAKGDISASEAKYSLINTFQIGGDGGWDYVTLSDDGDRAYLTRTTHTQIVRTSDGRILADIPGTERSHGVAIVSSLNRAFVTDGKAGTVLIVDLQTNQKIGKVAAAADADGIVFDPASKKLLVACGDAAVLVPIDANVDPTKGTAEAALDLGGKPEFLAVDGAGRAYVNVNDKGEVAVVDTKTMKIVAHWPTGENSKPTGMAIDPAKGRLFVGCRNRKLLVLSTADGAKLGELPIGRGNDACGFANGLVFASCGDGTLTIIGEPSPGKFEVVQTLSTAPGARTMAVDPHTGKVFLPAADMSPPTADQPNARPKPVPGSFKLLVAAPQAK